MATFGKVLVSFSPFFSLIHTVKPAYLLGLAGLRLLILGVKAGREVMGKSQQQALEWKHPTQQHPESSGI